MSTRWPRAPHREGAGATPQPPSRKSRAATISPRSRSEEIPPGDSRATRQASRRSRALARRSRPAARSDRPRHGRPRPGEPPSAGPAGAGAVRGGQRMMARGEEYGLPAQDEGGGQIGHRRVANIDEAQIVVAVPCPEDERRHIDRHPGTSGYILIADQENQ